MTKTQLYFLKELVNIVANNSGYKGKRRVYSFFVLKACCGETSVSEYGSSMEKIMSVSI
jgi:hypothetical protein